jgi:hypothetical protein
MRALTWPAPATESSKVKAFAIVFSIVDKQKQLPASLLLFGRVFKLVFVNCLS